MKEERIRGILEEYGEVKSLKLNKITKKQFKR